MALNAIGVEIQMVTFPRENQCQLDLLTRVGEWFDRHLKD